MVIHNYTVPSGLFAVCRHIVLRAAARVRGGYGTDAGGTTRRFFNAADADIPVSKDNCFHGHSIKILPNEMEERSFSTKYTNLV